MLLGQFYGVINPYIGFMAGMKAFTAAVLGGIGSIPGAMIGGLILGIAEALSSAYLSTEYKDVVSFALLIVVLLVMPTGILGSPGGRESMKPMQFAMALLSAAMFFVLAGVFMGVQLQLDGTKLVVGSAADIRWQWIFIGTAVVFLFQMLRPLFQKGLKSVSGPKFILPAIDGSTVKQKLFLIALLVIAVAWPFMVSRGTVDIATLTMIYIILGLGLNVVGGAVWPAGAGLRRLLCHRCLHLCVAEPLLRSGFLDLSANSWAGFGSGRLPARLPGTAAAR
ncbi:LIV-I protein H [Kluyvera intermedia]|nr:LIV-I protein H [Kluyvera intermedia]